MLGMRLCVLHNLYFYNHLMEDIRLAIEEHRYGEFKRRTLYGLQELDGIFICKGIGGYYAGFDKTECC